MELSAWLAFFTATMLCMSLVQSSGSGEKKFYIYDWPGYIDDVWPPDGAKLHNRSAYNFEFRPNRGAGKML